jgi:alanyl-tRNA synthetase
MARRSIEAKAGDDVAIVVNQTPFYGESGGQQGDQRHDFRRGRQALVTVTDTQKKAEGCFVHYGKVTEGVLKPGAVASSLRSTTSAAPGSAPTTRRRT